MVKEVDEGELKELIQTKPIVLVDYFTTWCGPCKIQKQILTSLEKLVDATIVSIDIDKNAQVAVELGIRAIPTLQFFKDGNVVIFKAGDDEVDRFVGVRQLDLLEEIVKKLSEGAELPLEI